MLLPNAIYSELQYTVLSTMSSTPGKYEYKGV